MSWSRTGTWLVSIWSEQPWIGWSVVLLGLGLLVVGFRGGFRRRLETPRCRRCGHQLPPTSAAPSPHCSECGAALNAPRAVVRGSSRPLLKLIGLILMLSGVIWGVGIAARKAVLRALTPKERVFSTASWAFGEIVVYEPFWPEDLHEHSVEVTLGGRTVYRSPIAFPTSRCAGCWRRSPSRSS